MQHYTIETGHCRDTLRSEVSDDAIAAVAPMLRSGEHTMPYPFDDYRLRGHDRWAITGRHCALETGAIGDHNRVLG